MSPGNRRRPGTFAFMVAAAYLTIAGVAVGVMLDGRGVPQLSASTTVVAALVLLFGLSIPIGAKPWARNARSLVATITIDFALLVLILFLAPSPWSPAILFFVLIPASSRLSAPLRYAIYLAAPLVTFAAVASGGHLVQEWSSIASIAPGFIAIVVFTESYRAVRESSRESRKLLNELISAQERLREVTLIEERQRIAQEMHDAVGHRLTVASIQLEAVCRLIASDPARAAELAADSREQVRAGLAELRQAVNSLGAPEFEPRSLRRRIEETVDNFRQGCAIEVVTELDPRADEVDALQATVLLRSVQEGLTNIQRHAAAAHARVSLALNRGANDRIELLLEDDGSGISDGVSAASAVAAVGNSGGFGLRSLRERAEALGGSAVFTRVESGSRLAVTLPARRR
ncbi:MAG TPA: histidine kinase [Spirochaetia bacterium]|nr:histidine kinase [Spirochaetia bacterium]